MKSIVLLSLMVISAAVASEQSRSAQSMVHLNHFYVVLNPTDYQALANSDFVKSTFASYETRTTVRTDKTYTGLYLYGTNSYIEFFNAADTINNPAGNPLDAPNGIAFGVDQTGDAAAIGIGPDGKQRLKFMPITRAVANPQGKITQVPWFLMWQVNSNLAGASKIFTTWMMEYQPEFLKVWHPELNTPVGVTRALILSRYKAFVESSTGIKQGHRLFDDVKSLRLEFPQNDIDMFVQTATAFGCTIYQTPMATVVQTAEQTISLSPGPSSQILSAQIHLNKPSPARRLIFGDNTVLEFNGDDTASLRFSAK